MLQKIFELIDDFSPQPIKIPLDKSELETIARSLFTWMFPVCDELKMINVRSGLMDAAIKLHANIARLIGNPQAEEKTEAFFSRLSGVRERLYKDAACYLRNDPAAKSLEEVIIAYPGFFALSIHRIAHELYTLGIPLIPRIFSEYAHSKVGIDIHPGATIGKNLFMDHGTGIVIGETTEIGNNVKIYQGVTLGAIYLEKKLSEVKRHPTVEDNVIIYSGATILGGSTVIGHDSTIGGGAWLTHSVMPYSLVYNKVDVKVKTVKGFEEPINYSI